jgi:sugar fermentation stimulation protein A
MKGIYCLFIHLPKDTHIEIGKLGRLFFPQGVYIYVGSALNNMEKRITRHKKKDKKMHWHIDYFLQHATITNTLTIETQDKLECSIAQLISLIPRVQEIPHFGSSDCHCTSHLFHFPVPPDTPTVPHSGYIHIPKK